MFPKAGAVWVMVNLYVATFTSRALHVWTPTKEDLDRA
jgi:hypothetical protein